MAEKAPTLAEVEQESVHDSILASMAEVVGEPLEEKTPAATATPAEATPAKETDAEATARQERDALGRFKAKAGEEAAAEAADKVEQPATGDGKVPEPPVATEAEPIDPPTEWKAAEQDQFRSLPRPQQEFVLAKYNALREAEGKVAQTAGKYAPLEQMLAPRRAALARDGLDDVAYLQYLDRLSQSAAQDPEGFSVWFAQQRGVSAERLIARLQGRAPQAGQQQAPPADPYIHQLEQRFGRIEATLQGEAQRQREAQERAQQADQRALANQISSFGTAADDKGKLQHPYFEEVRSHMGALLKAELASDLQTAYDMACRAHPEVSRKIESAAKARADQDRQAEQRKKAEAARKAGSSISGTPGDRSSPPPSGDIREDLRQQLAARGLIN